MDYFSLLIAGDLDGLLSLFAGEPRLNDPHAGLIQGRPAFETFVHENSSWLKERQAEVERVATTSTSLRIVEESILHLQEDQEHIALPVALAADLSAPPDHSHHSDHSDYLDQLDHLDHIRIYHSQWPLLKTHRLRPPILPAHRDLTLSGAVARYQGALAQGDLETILDQFEPDGYAREPAGGQYIHRGPAELRRFYSALFASSGGIPLEHCTLTDDGVRCAIEYNVTRWGKAALPPQAGIAVYERGPSGLIVAARIYDDVDPP